MACVSSSPLFPLVDEFHANEIELGRHTRRLFHEPIADFSQPDRLSKKEGHFVLAKPGRSKVDRFCRDSRCCDSSSSWPGTGYGLALLRRLEACSFIMFTDTLIRRSPRPPRLRSFQLGSNYVRFLRADCVFIASPGASKTFLAGHFLLICPLAG